MLLLFMLAGPRFAYRAFKDRTLSLRTFSETHKIPVLLIGAGVYPKPVLDIINPAVKVTMSQVHTTDPKPAHPAGDTTAAQKGTAP